MKRIVFKDMYKLVQIHRLIFKDILKKEFYLLLYLRCTVTKNWKIWWINI